MAVESLFQFLCTVSKSAVKIILMLGAMHARRPEPRALASSIFYVVLGAMFYPPLRKCVLV